MKNSINIIYFLLTLFLHYTLAQKNPHYVNGRSTIVHLFEWKWVDIAKECERFLSPHGYGGVQVSPPNENLIIRTNRPWWDRYQPVSYKIATKSGNEQEFTNMTRRCNKVGVRIYADVVFNHMSTTSKHGKGTGGSDANPYEYPAIPYGNNDFHYPCEIVNYNDAENVRNCQLNRLQDLNQGKESVRRKIIDYLDHLVDLGVAGFRVDAAKHMWPEDLRKIYAGVKNLNIEHGFPANSRPFIYQEVIDLGGEAISKNEYTDFGVVTEFKFGATLGTYFRGNNKLADLKTWGPSWGMLADENALVFIDNHDNQRGHGAGGSSILNYKTAKNYKMANAFMLAHPYGITRTMSSFGFDNSDAGPPQDAQGNTISPEITPDYTCTNGWICEHRWRQIYNMIEFKNQVKNTSLNNWWDNGNNQIAFCRGDQGFIAFTLDGDLKQNLQTCLPSGSYCDVISGSSVNGRCTGKVVNVVSGGKANIEILGNEFDGVLAIHRNAQQLNSKLYSTFVAN